MDNTCNNLPEKFLERLKRLYSDEEYTQVLNAFSSKPLPTFRTNTLKIHTDELAEKLQNDGFNVEPVSWYPDAFILQNKSIRELTETDLYKEGLLYIQNLSSMIPVLVLDPKPGERVLDLAAAPGSKTTQIAALMSNRGELVANDASRARLYKMEAILGQYGIAFQKGNVIARTGRQEAACLTGVGEAISDITGLPRSYFARNDDKLSVQISNSRGETLWKRYPEYFDKTLVDVPCTMEGRIQCDDAKTYEDWSTKKIKQLSMLQKYLLRSAISATKPGGIIVYSTCTLAPEENEEVIDWVLKREGNNIEIEKINISGLAFNSGLSSWNKSFNPEITKTARIVPSNNMEGFFVAKIKKLKSSLPNSRFE